jgi:dTDP-4-dehydrorhamnose 3,5-epimerase
MGAEIIDFETRRGSIEGMLVVTIKQVSDERGTVRELFRRSAFAAADRRGEEFGHVIGEVSQINVTESRYGAIRGMHAEDMTKLLTLAHGEAFGAFIDTRVGSPTRGVVETISLRPGVQVMLPSGVANGFQSLTEASQYVYCFDAEWRPGMPGVACNPLDPALAIPWPIEIDPDDTRLLSVKDRNAPAFADLEV